MTRYYGHWLALGVLGIAATGCARIEGESQGEQSGGKPGTAAQIARVINVEADQVAPSDFIDYIRITGEAEALHDIVVSAEEGGLISGFSVEKGRSVRQGQTIAHIEASVLSAQADEARAAAALAGERFERQRRLWEDERIGSEINFLQAKFEWEMAQARLATLEARLAKTSIRAPVAGVLDEHFVDAGEIVLPGTRVARVVSIGTILVTGGIPERYAPFVRPGRSAVVTFDIMPGRPYPGEIRYVGSSVDDQSRTFPIEIVLTNPNGAIKPQMVANVLLVREELSDVIVLSQDHVVRSETGYHVYVVDDVDGAAVARKRPVTLGPAYAGRVVIEAGLAMGDLVVGLGAQLVDDGNRIRIVPGAAGREIGQ